MDNRKNNRKRSVNWKNWSMLLVGTGLLLLGVISALWISGIPAQELSKDQDLSAMPLAVEYQAPEFFLQDLQGKEVSLSGLHGQVVLVNNWATWCPPCKAEMPTLQAYYDQHKQDGFVLVGIEAGDPEPDVQDFVEQYGLTFPVWLDPESKALMAFNNDALPSSYVVDEQGMVRLAWIGPISQEMLEKYVTPLLED